MVHPLKVDSDLITVEVSNETCIHIQSPGFSRLLKEVRSLTYKSVLLFSADHPSLGEKRNDLPDEAHPLAVVQQGFLSHPFLGIRALLQQLLRLGHQAQINLVKDDEEQPGSVGVRQNFIDVLAKLCPFSQFKRPAFLSFDDPGVEVAFLVLLLLVAFLALGGVC